MAGARGLRVWLWESTVLGSHVGTYNEALVGRVLPKSPSLVSKP